MNWYLKVLKQYADFSGRARRKEYWIFVLFNMIFAMIALILDNVLGLTVGELPYGVIYFLYLLAVVIPSLALAVRRLHDVGKSGWMILISLIPIVGAIWLLVLMVTDSNTGENEYGANPKDTFSTDNITNDALSSTNTNDSSTGDTVILLAVIWMFTSRLIWTLIPKLIDNFYSLEWFKPINALLLLIWSVIPIGLAFAIKNKSKQLVLLILGSIYFLYSVYEIVMSFKI